MGYGLGVLMDFTRAFNWPKPLSTLRSIFWSFIGLWAKIGHGNRFACSESRPVQSSRSKSTTRPRKGRLLRFQSNRHIDYRWWCTKTWKRSLAWFWIDCNQSLQPNQSQMKCYVWKPCRDLHWLDELRFSNWRFFEQFAYQNNHLLLTNHQ